jgi:hypothetical protein
MEHPQFEIIVSDSSTSANEWRRAQQAPRSKLPELNPEQKGEEPGATVPVTLLKWEYVSAVAVELRLGVAQSA